VNVSLAAEAEQELVEGAPVYAREANAKLGHAFNSELERSAAICLSDLALAQFGAAASGGFAAPVSLQHRLLRARIRGSCTRHCSSESQARVLARASVAGALPRTRGRLTVPLSGDTRRGIACSVPIGGAVVCRSRSSLGVMPSTRCALLAYLLTCTHGVRNRVLPRAGAC
jgi:hypothetical protein